MNLAKLISTKYRLTALKQRRLDATPAFFLVCSSTSVGRIFNAFTVHNGKRARDAATESRYGGVALAEETRLAD